MPNCWVAIKSSWFKINRGKSGKKGHTLRGKLKENTPLFTIMIYQGVVIKRNQKAHP